MDTYEIRRYFEEEGLREELARSARRERALELNRFLAEGNPMLAGQVAVDPAPRLVTRSG